MKEGRLAHELWVIRAGQRARYLDLFRSTGIVAVGFSEVADHDLTAVGEPDLISRATTRSLASGVGQLRRFAFQIDTNDIVITPGAPGGDQRYYVGQIAGSYEYVPSAGDEGVHQRQVRWMGSFSASEISAPTRSSLDAASTLFKPTQGEAELRAVLSGLDPEGSNPGVATPNKFQPVHTSPRSRELEAAELDVSVDSAGRALIRSHHPALEMEQTPRHLDPGDPWRRVPGIYVLTGTELDASTTRTGLERALTTTLVTRPWAYVGLSESFFARLASHRQSKPEWRRALLVRSAGHPFSGDDIRYLERKVHDLLMETDEVLLAQSVPHGTVAAVPRDIAHLDACAATVLTVLRLTGTLI